jgi:hypothetical protein
VGLGGQSEIDESGPELFSERWDIFFINVHENTYRI